MTHPSSQTWRQQSYGASISFTDEADIAVTPISNRDAYIDEEALDAGITQLNKKLLGKPISSFREYLVDKKVL